MSDNLLVRAERFARNAHRSTNHLYDGQPYDKTHLEMVVNWAGEYINLIPVKD